MHQSPFNVGVTIELEDFNESQVQELNRHYRSPLNQDEIPTLMAFLNGHPYLTAKALYTIVTKQITWDELTHIAVGGRGPFSDHLRRYLWMLHDHRELKAALKQVIRRGKCSDEVSYYRLLQVGLIKGANWKSCSCRCRLYEEYLKENL
jgi:AAA-like domain